MKGAENRNKERNTKKKKVNKNSKKNRRLFSHDWRLHAIGHHTCCFVGVRLCKAFVDNLEWVNAVAISNAHNKFE